MRHWSQLATRNWRDRPARTLGALLAISLGVAAVVWVSTCYESVRQTVLGWALGYIGNADISITSPLGKYDQIPQRLAAQIRELDNVALVTPQLVNRLPCEPWPRALADAGATQPASRTEHTPEIDLTGIDLGSEFAIRQYVLTAGRMLGDGDELACVLEAGFAERAGLGVGDYLLVFAAAEPSPHALEIVGLFDRKRVARFQAPAALIRLPVLQQLNVKQGLLTSIDVVLEDGGAAALARSAQHVRERVRRISREATVRTSEARLKQIEAAQSQQQFVVALLSSVALLTALFIILSTLSMGMVERIRALGLLRCVGTTRLRLAALILAEVLPLGVAGVVLGSAIGLALAAMTVWLVPDYVGQFPFSWDELRRAAAGGAGPLISKLGDLAARNGLLTGAAAGLLTTLLAALLPAAAALGVSPMEATRPRSRRTRVGLILAVGLLAVGTLLGQHFGLVEQTRRATTFLQYASAGVMVLYLGYAMLAPLAVRMIGTLAVYAAAGMLAVRARLLQDQVGHAVWRSSGICCGLMVGLSLIVAVSVVNKSITDGWQFPKQFPEAYLWNFSQLTGDADDRLRGVNGIASVTVANSVNVIVEERPVFAEQLLLSVTWFMGVDPDTFFDLVRLEFLEGDEKSARALLREGGHVLVSDDFARSRNKNLGDSINVHYLSSPPRTRQFKIAGVVRSPALDIAAGYFQLQTQYSVAASGSVMGTRRDLARQFGVDGANLVLLNFDFTEDDAPADWPPVDDTPAAAGLTARDYDESVPAAKRWRRHRQESVLREVQDRLDAPQSFTGSVAELKDEIDVELKRMTQLLTAVPGVALLVAAIGVANLMTANVTARVREMAILRAVGATRGVLLRLVVGEALVLGLLGSALGLALGLHLACDTTLLIDRMWGFRVAMELPWDLIAGAVLLTVGLCVVAGVAPARYAARTDVVRALHST